MAAEMLKLVVVVVVGVEVVEVVEVVVDRPVGPGMLHGF